MDRRSERFWRDNKNYHCSKCYEDTGFTTDCKWKFCPNCGAKMESENEQSSHFEGNLVDGVPSDKSERYNNF